MKIPQTALTICLIAGVIHTTSGLAGSFPVTVKNTGTEKNIDRTWVMLEGDGTSEKLYKNRHVIKPGAYGGLIFNENYEYRDDMGDRGALWFKFKNSNFSKSAVKCNTRIDYTWSESSNSYTYTTSDNTLQSDNSNRLVFSVNVDQRKAEDNSCSAEVVSTNKG